MTRTQRILSTISCMISLGGVACDGADRFTPEEPAARVAREEDGPVARTDGAGGCGCGRFADDDGDGGCDRAASGECRRGREGRCPCSGGCAGCF